MAPAPHLWGGFGVENLHGEDMGGKNNTERSLGVEGQEKHDEDHWVRWRPSGFYGCSGDHRVLQRPSRFHGCHGDPQVL